MICPKCSSDNVQRLEVVFEGGTQNINTKSNSAGIGIGLGGLGLGLGKTKTKGTAQSKSAQKASPPMKKPFKLLIVALIWSLYLLSSAKSSSDSTFLLIIGFIAFAFSAFMIYKRVSWNKNSYPILYETWTNSWLCNKCGNIYQNHN